MTVMDYRAIGGSFVAVPRIFQGFDRGNTSHLSSALVVAGSAAWLGKGLSCVCICAKRRESDSRLSFDLTPAVLAHAPEMWFNEFSTARKHHGPLNEQRVDELPMLNVQDWADEFGDRMGKEILGDSSAYNGAEAYFKYLNEEATAKQRSEASCWVYAFSDLNKNVGRQELFSGAVVSLEAEVLNDPDSAKDWRLLGIPNARNDDDQWEAARALWDAAFPEKELHNLVSELWKEMGWQGKDPSVDLRCSRYISLENLLCFAGNILKSFPVLLQKQEGDGAMWEYPFAVAGVNITSMLIQILDLEAEVVVGSAAWLGKGLSCVCAPPIRDSDSRLPFDLTPAEMAASKYIAYATFSGLVGVYNTHTRESRERDLVRFWQSIEPDWTHVCALEFSPDGKYIFAVLGDYILVLDFTDLDDSEMHFIGDIFDESLDRMLVSFEHHTLCISNSEGFRFWLIGSEGQLYDLLDFPDIGFGRTCIDYDPYSRIFVSGRFSLIEGGIGGTSELETWDFWGLQGRDDNGTPIHTRIAAIGLDVVDHIAIHRHSICATLASQEVIMYKYCMLTGFDQNVRIPAMEGHVLVGCCFPYRNIWWTDINRHCPVILIYTDIIVLREANNVMYTATVPDHQQVTAYTPGRFGPYLYLGTHSGHIITYSYGQMTFQLRSLTQVTNNTIKYMTDYTSA